jgi:hypothetical protein
VRQLVAVQGGWITVSSREGGGTVFSITLPRQATMLAGTGRLPAVGGGAQARRGNDMSLVG